MKENQASITALVTAFVRAFHATHDSPKIFDDFVADRLFTEQERVFFGKNLAMALKMLDPDLYVKCADESEAVAGFMRAHTNAATLSRSKYAEEMLKKEYDSGVKQYVLLGAGMDTFAFREAELMKTLQVFEVDYPATQEMKKSRLSAAGLELHGNLHFVPFDFTNGNLEEALLKSGYKSADPAFFSWLGVTYYLPAESVYSTFGEIVKIAAPGSSVVFDYMEKKAFMQEESSEKFKRFLAFMKNTGEPMITGFEPSELKFKLSGLKLRIKEDLGPDEIERRLIGVRDDGYHAADYVHFVTAQI